MGIRISQVKQFEVEVPRAAKNDVKKAAKAVTEEARVSATGNDLNITVGKDRVTLTANAAGWASPKLQVHDDDSETTLAVLDAVVRVVGGVFVADVDRDGATSETRFEAPRGGGEAPALWAAKRVIAEVVKVSSVDASAALAAMSERPTVKRTDLDEALGAEADRVWAALDKQGLVRDGEIPTRSLYIWMKKQV